MEPITAALTLGAQLLRAQVAQQQAYIGSGRGHATASLAQLAYLSGNRDPRVLALMAGYGVPTLQEALAAVDYYGSGGKITTTAAMSGLQAFTENLQTIPSTAFGYPTLTDGKGPMRQAYVPYVTVGGVTTTGREYVWLDADGTKARQNVIYKNPDGTCQIFKPSFLGKGVPLRDGVGFMQPSECGGASTAPPAFTVTIPGLGEPVSDVQRQTAAIKQLYARRFTTPAQWGGFSKTRGWDAALRYLWS